MATIIDYLDAAAAACSPASDYQLARELGISKQNLSGYRYGVLPSDRLMLMICTICGADPRAGLIDLQAWRADRAGQPEVADQYRSALSILPRSNVLVKAKTRRSKTGAEQTRHSRPA